MSIGLHGPFDGLEFGEGLSETTPPFLSGQTPAPSDTGVSVSANVNFTIDDLDSGVVLSSVVVQIDSGSGFVTAYTSSAFQAGFTGSATLSGIGYAFVVNPNVDFPYSQVVQVRVQGSDADGNSLDTTYSFTTEATADVTPPYLELQNPAPSATGVAVSSNIFFKVSDAVSGVDLTTVLIEVNTGSGFVTAYQSSTFQPGFTGSAVLVGIGYEFTVNPNTNFNEFTAIQVRVTASDLAGVPNVMGPVTYSFTTDETTLPVILNRNPTATQVSVDVASNIAFRLDDPTPGSGVDQTTIDVTIDEGAGPVVAILNGAFVSPYNGAGSAITPVANGFDVVIDPVNPLTDDSNIEIGVTAEDFSGNILSTSYTFSTADPPAPPPPEPPLTGIAGFPLDMYRFLHLAMREADHKEGNLFVKRLLVGPNTAWQSIVKGLEKVPELWSFAGIEDKFLKYLKNIVGWTAELEHITSRLDDAALRRLIGASGALWRERGPESAIINILQIVTGGSRMRIWNWFNFRWILDETGLGEEHARSDPWIIDAPSESRVPQFSDVLVQPNAEQFSNLRIADDNGTLDRELVKDVLRLMRGAGERFDITYLNFLDLFETPGDHMQWDKPASLDFIVEDNLGKLVNLAITERTTVVVDGSADWEQYVVSALCRGTNSAASNWGLMFYYQDVNNCYILAVDTFSQLLTLQKRVSGTPTVIATVNLGLAEINILAGVFYTLRVEIIRESGTNRMLAFVDGSQLINTTDSQFTKGTVGLFHDPNATIECDDIELFELPGDSETLEINS